MKLNRETGMSLVTVTHSSDLSGMMNIEYKLVDGSIQKVR